ncbi:MAG: glycosyltransferase [Candidatus Magasanikbacteria bacterium]|nr:glycosyltransferase [Candidatus Magasanikbacteria bacterium]MBT4071710.1 glycosyltransferase [Candidatus Magasanikbacteria bacterium]
MKSIALINNLYGKYARGGAERVVEQLARHYQAGGKHVIVISLGKKNERIEHDGVVVYYYKAPQIFSYVDLDKHGLFLKMIWHAFNICNIFSALGIVNILKKEKVSLVHTHNLMGLGLCLPVAFRKRNIKHIHTVHDVQLVEPSGVLSWDHKKDNLFQVCYKYITKLLMGSPAEVIFPSQYMSDFYTSRGFFKKSKKKVLSIHNSYKQKTSKKIQTYVFVGTLSEHKGAHLLPEIWNDIDDKTLIIVGDGELRERISSWAKKQDTVTYLGRLEKVALEEIYKKADCLIFPSICIENRPNVLEEALAHGLSIIASDTGGVREVLAEVSQAHLVTPGVVEEFREQILS